MDTRKELADMIDSMSEEQFTQFFIKAIQDPETRAAVVGILERFQSEKYTYRFLGFCVVLTALSRLRWCTQQPISRGSMVDVLLLYPCFNTFSRGFLAASRRNIQDGDFSLFALCSTAFLIVANGIFSPLCRRFAFAGLACLGEQERDVSRSIFPELFVE